MWPVPWRKWKCMFKTRCMLFYLAKTIGFVNWGYISPFCLDQILRAFQQPTLFAATGHQPTTNLFIISFLSRTIDFFFFFLSLWIYLWLAETSQQPISQTTWLKVTPHCNFLYVLVMREQASAPNYAILIEQPPLPSIFSLALHPFKLDDTNTKQDPF